MTKTTLTKTVEKAILNHNNKMGVFACVEVMIGNWRSKSAITDQIEIVDVMTYETTGLLKCWEVKTSLADLKSKALLSFYGDYNYLVLPYELFVQASDKELLTKYYWQGIGVFSFKDGKLYCERKAKKKTVDLGLKVLMLESMNRSLARDAGKYYRQYYQTEVRHEEINDISLFDLSEV
ncbi:hypothetical protein AB3329_01765 [Streptococcus sp. H31]|uniref:hypothetical protein n=1 Tax=Streptococcus huangxiaojuni TaxID=3237239 RepID=UPI0034A44B06